MKRIIIIMTTLVLVACSREKQQESALPFKKAIPNLTSTNTKKDPKPTSGKNAKMIKTNKCDATVTTNCTLMNKGTREAPRKYDELVDMLKLAPANGNHYVSDLFNSSDFEEISEQLDSIDLVKLQSDTYYLNINYEADDVVVFMAGPTNPVSTENMDFGFQLPK
ncbi:MAG: hypothetical protein V4538_11685 [Bacteroidota bacterium]